MIDPYAFFQHFAYIYIYIYMRYSSWLYTLESARMFVHVSVHMHVHMHTHTYIHTYTCIHTTHIQCMHTYKFISLSYTHTKHACIYVT